MRRHKGYTLINILGLSVGLMVSFTILLWVQDELSYDRFHEDSDQLYRVMRTARYGDGQVYTFPAITYRLDSVLDEEYPEIEMGALQGWPEELTFTRNNLTFRESGRHAGVDYFKMFDYSFLAGDQETALVSPTAVVLTESMARKYFGEHFASTTNAQAAAQTIIGESLLLDNRLNIEVTGIIEDPPAQSSIQFDFLLPVDELLQRNAWMDEWGNNGIWMFVKLQEGADAAVVSEKIKLLIQERAGDTITELFLQPYTDMYLRSKYENGVLVGGRIDYVRIFGFVSLFVLILACINFMNLATARSAQRSLEVGIRKTFGSSRKSLTSQFMGEAILLALFSLVVAVIGLFILLPGFNAITQKELAFTQISPVLWGQFIGITLLTGLLSGLYPAVYLSSIKLMDVLRKGISETNKGRGLRRGLVVFQFAVSIILIVGALTIHNQMDYIRSKNLGMDRENVLYSTLEGGMVDQYDVVREQLLQEPSILNVTSGTQNPLRIGHSTPAPQWDGKDPDDNTLFYIVSTTYGYVETMNMELAAGRTFSPDFRTDTSNVIINETAARAMGMDNPVGERFAMWGREGQIVGVVKDFHMTSMYNAIEPVVFRLEESPPNILFLRTEAGQTEEAIAAFESVFNTFNSEYPFEYNFLDTSYEQMYRSEVVIGKLTNYFTVLALFIACLGLFGLASFTTARRTREIAIRKVLGATVSQVVVLLSREFLLLIGIAFVIGTPVAYFLLSDWLTGFEYRVTIGASVFITAALSLVLVTTATISFQSVRAALANPARSMRAD